MAPTALLFFSCLYVTVRSAEYPWKYDNLMFGGPDFWGLVNKKWRLCSAGQLQSPINIDPSLLLYDPNLTPVEMDKNTVEASLENMGQLPLLTIKDSLISSKNINISGGPTFPYRYRLHHFVFHFGNVTSKQEWGSEHTVDYTRFPAEIGAVTNSELKKLTTASQEIVYKGLKTVIKRFNPYSLLPRTTDYITYPGSLTFPGCYETVTWVLMNNPIYITESDLLLWNKLQQTESAQNVPVSMSLNYRPLRALNGRLLRTNINFKQRDESQQTCPSNIYVNLGYKANPDRVVMNTTKQRRYSVAANSNNIFTEGGLSSAALGYGSALEYIEEL